MQDVEPVAPPRFDAELLRVFLSQREALCPGCGYNLHGLMAEKCPECAAELSLSLSAVPPLSARARRWILVFAWLIFAHGLSRVGFGLFWMVRFTRIGGVFAGMSRGMFTVQIAEMTLWVVYFIAAVVMLLMLVLSSAARDKRYRRCLLSCTILVAAEICWGMLSQLVYPFLW